MSFAQELIGTILSSGPLTGGVTLLGSVVGLSLVIKVNMFVAQRQIALPKSSLSRCRNTLTSFSHFPIDSKALKSIYMTFLRPGKNLKKLGKWAVVTGATDGIGKAYATALAKKGMSVVLISRTEAKLKEVQGEILGRGCSGIDVKCIVCDYSKFDATSQAVVKKVLDELDIGLLVNNVGVSYRYPLYFHELPDEEVANLLSMNVESTVWMTRMVVPGMLKRQRGAIVNISSGSALYTLPLLAEYSGAKSFVEKFSRAINAEYRGKGITCQCQVPFYVATKLAKMRPSLTVPTPTAFVNMAINWVGYPDALVQPFWIHALQGWIMHQIPDFVVAKVIMAMHLAIRSKGLKKDARAAEEHKGKKA